MSLYNLEDELNKWFKQQPQELQDDFKIVTGIVFDSLQGLEAKNAALQIYRIKRRKKIEESKDEEIRKQQQEFQLKLAEAQAKTFGSIISTALSQISQMFLNYQGRMTEQMEQIIHTLESKYRDYQPSLTEGTKPKGQLPPPSLSYTNCIRYHDPTPENPVRRPGPGRCVLTTPQEDGIHMRCIVAYVSQNPDDKGFARLPYQIFHAELLRQGDCPRPLSRSVTRRIPGLSWLFVKPDVCPLADGGEHILEYGRSSR